MDNSLGAFLRNQGQLTEAEASYRRALEIRPDYAEAHSNLGNTLQAQGRLTDAVASYRRALELRPDLAQAHYNLGITLQEQGRLADAEASHRRALEFSPVLVGANYNLGIILQGQGRHSDAEASYRRALEIEPDYPEAHYNLGVTLQEQGRLTDAEASYRRALAIKPDLPGARYNLGVTLRELGQLDEAMANFRLSLSAKGDWKESLRRLTTPLVLHTHLEMGPRYPAASLVEARNQDTTSKEQVNHFTAPTVPAVARPELHLLEAGQAESGISRKSRIILIYPPPWQIPSPGDPLLETPFGPPRDINDRDLDEGFQTITFGLLTLAAQAKRAGHDVSVYNLSTCPWRDVGALISETEADVYGISAFSGNRRGMGAVAALIRQHHPQAHITAGGPFVTALPLDTLRYFRDIDTAVIGEGETTFMELLEYLELGRPAVGIPGTAWRNGEEIIIGPMRQRIDDLDALASPFDYFTGHMVITSRGCPSKCTFCGSSTTWGNKLRFHSAANCLDTFLKALARLPLPFLAIKDDTFTAYRLRTIAICDAIIEKKMNFMWSCDTRADSLDEELLYKMRLAGCQMISLGVESGSPQILKTIHKQTSPETVLEATRAAKKYGMCVRYYMILLNRGETAETIKQSVDLIKAGRPEIYSFSNLAFFPGTEEWAVLCEQQGLTPDIFFRNDFKELSVTTNRHQEAEDVLLQVVCDIGAFYGFRYSVEEREAVVERLPNLHSVHVELANAYFRAGRLDEAESALNRAEVLGFPIDVIIYNQRACIALARGEVDNALSLLERACRAHPNHIGMGNLDNLRNWVNIPLNDRGKPPLLNDSVLALDFYRGAKLPKQFQNLPLGLAEGRGF